MRSMNRAACDGGRLPMSIAALPVSNRIYVIKVSFWGSGTLRIVILVGNHPRNVVFGWLIITLPLGGGVN